MKIGYARVSTEEQNLDSQIDALKAAGCEKIFEDNGISAVAEIRPGFVAALAAAHAGDKFVIWKLDRAFRSTVDAILTLDHIRGRGVEFECLTMHIDTTTPEGRKWYRDTASWAEYERELISQRTKAGMAAAKRRGKHVGRPRKLTKAQVHHAQRQLAIGGETISGMAEMFGVAALTLSRALKSAEEAKRNPQFSFPKR